MRQLLTLLFLLSLATCALAQDVIERGYGLELTVHHGSRRLSGGRVFTLLERQDSLESGRFGYATGLIYTSRVNKIGFTTGLRYVETGYLVGRQDDSRSPGASFEQEATARYLSIPFELNFYQDITTKDRVFFTMGIAGHFHLGTTINQTNFLNEEQTTEEELDLEEEVTYRSPIISLNTGLGFDRKLSDSWTLRLEPSFQFFLQGNLVDPEVNLFNRNFYQLGGRVLVRRMF